MKTTIAFFTFLFLLVSLQAAPSSTIPIGSFVTLSGRVTKINTTAGSFHLGEDEVYFVTGNSVLTLEGKRVTITNLAVGMKVSGSAEVTKGDSRSEPPKKVVRMATATIVPPEVGTVHRPGFDEKGEDLKKRLAGTFWSVPYQENERAKIETIWICLDADGTTTCSESNRLEHWSVLSVSNVNVTFSVRLSVPRGTAVAFNADLTTGVDSAFPRTDRFLWKRIASPAQSMVAKAAQRPAASRPVTPSDTSVPVGTGAAAVVNPVSIETQRAALDLLKASSRSLVFVSSKAGASSGFVANLGGTNYLVTDAQVAMGINEASFKTLDGTVIPHAQAEVASGHDIFRMAFPNSGKALEVMEDVSQNARVGDEVVLLGNAGDSGVVSPIIGHIAAIGPNTLVTNLPYGASSNGSPLVHLKTGKVVGVALYMVTQTYDASTLEKTRGPMVRRFGYRLDSVKAWQPVNWEAFSAQAAVMEKIHGLTEALNAFFLDLSKTGGRVTAARHTHVLIRNRISQWLESRSHNISAADRKSTDGGFVSFLKVVCQTDVADAQRFLTYDYFQRRLVEEQKTRSEMAKAFADTIENLRN